MFKIRPISSNAMTTPKSFKTNNVPVNVVNDVTTRNQQLEQQVFKERELVKTEGVEEWQQEECL
jgi:hypothetical protein